MALSDKTPFASTMAKAEHPAADVEGMTTDSQDESSHAGPLMNASGHRDALTRQYGLLGITGIAVAINNPWVVLGSSISVSIRMYLLVLPLLLALLRFMTYWTDPLTI